MSRDEAGDTGDPGSPRAGVPPGDAGAADVTDVAPGLRLARWTVTSGSNAASRGAVVIDFGDHHWQASSQGNGAVDALLEAVDKALTDLLAGTVKLVGYDLQALGEGPDAEALVRVRIRPPVGAEGPRALGEYAAESRHTNIIAASIEAYVQAINSMLGEAQWAGAAAAAGHGRPSRHPHGRRAEFDRSSAHADTASWFDQ
jgi:hypothetical protein